MGRRTQVIFCHNATPLDGGMSALAGKDRRPQAGTGVSAEINVSSV